MIKRIGKGIIYFLGVCSLIGLLASACASEEVENTQTVTTDKGTIMVIPEEPDSEVEMIPQDKNDYERLAEAEQLLDTYAYKSFGKADIPYEIESEKVGNTLVVYLRVHMDAEAVIPYVGTDSWYTLIDEVIEASSNARCLFEISGYEDVHVSFLIGDFNLDKYYYGTLDSEVIYNIENELN